MGSKRHRPTRPPSRADKMSRAHKAARLERRAKEIDIEISGSGIRAIDCPECGEPFASAQINPTCLNCGAVLSRRRP